MTADKETFSNQVASIVKELGYTFTLKGQPIVPNDVITPTGLLPALMRRADQLCSFCFGYGLGVTFDRSDNALLGVTFDLDDKAATSLRLLCVADVLIEIVQNAPNKKQIALDELLLD